MGGGKKPSLSQIERAQRREEEKKSKKKSDDQKQRTVALPTTVNTTELMGKIRDLGAITPHSVISVMPMSIGDAKRFLGRMERDGVLVRVSSFNGQPVYLLKASNPEPSTMANPAQ